jgi:hypothetical protein
MQWNEGRRTPNCVRLVQTDLRYIAARLMPVCYSLVAKPTGPPVCILAYFGYDPWMDPNELHDRLLEDARQYDPGRHTRSLLAPYRDVLLLQRAKFMSYEQISATLTRHGLNISGPAVGCADSSLPNAKSMRCDGP